MKDGWLFLIHLLTAAAKLLGPGGVKGIIAENLQRKQQLFVVYRPRQWAPNLSPANRFLLGFFSLFPHTSRIMKTSVCIRPKSLVRSQQSVQTSIISDGGHIATNWSNSRSPHNR